MQTLRVVVFASCTVLITMLFGATLAPGARADQWDRKTIVTFSDSVEVPGQVLPAGTYVFRLADSPTDRHIVQIWNADETQILATDRKSTRLNSSHSQISYAVFCLKKKKR